MKLETTTTTTRDYYLCGNNIATATNKTAKLYIHSDGPTREGWGAQDIHDLTLALQEIKEDLLKQEDESK